MKKPIEQFTFTAQLCPTWQATPKSEQIALDRLPEDSKLASPKSSQRFLDSIKNYGVIQPIVVIDHGDHYEVAAGRRRIKAARAAGQTNIPSQIYPNNWTIREILTIIENEQRQPNFITNLEAFHKLTKQGTTTEEIQAHTGLNQRQIDELTNLLSLGDTILNALTTNQINLPTAKAILKGGTTTRTRAESVLADPTHKLTATEVRSWLSANQQTQRQILASELFAPTPWTQTVQQLVSRAMQNLPPEAELLRQQLSNCQDLLNHPPTPQTPFVLVPQTTITATNCTPGEVIPQNISLPTEVG